MCAHIKYPHPRSRRYRATPPGLYKAYSRATSCAACAYYSKGAGFCQLHKQEMNDDPTRQKCRDHLSEEAGLSREDRG